MKVLYVSDFHGAEWKYRRTYEIAAENKVDMVINGGDLLPNKGDLHDQGKFIKEFLDDHLQRFDSAGIKYLCYLGNFDLRIFDELFARTCGKYDNIIDMPQSLYQIGGYEFIGMNLVTDYPFPMKDRCRVDMADSPLPPQMGQAILSTDTGWDEPTDWEVYVRSKPSIMEEMAMLTTPTNMSKSIYIVHMPPANLGLGTVMTGMDVGSQAIYDFVKEKQPRLLLSGHIHESPDVSGVWKAEMERTICLQPGQQENLTYVLIDLETLEMTREIESPA